MKIYLNEITGIADAIVSMYMSKRSWTRELELEIRDICSKILNKDGSIKDIESKEMDKYNDYMSKIVKFGWRHTTLLRFIDMSITVEGLHRGGQDDWDSHAARFNNRIVRSSTRLSEYEYEKSEWYENKIIPTDTALSLLGISVPEEIDVDGKSYVKTINGYIEKEFIYDKDVKRGLYMLSIPSNFIFKVNLTEWAHVYKERNNNSNANPEVRICCENIADQIESFQPLFDRKLFDKIKN